MTTCEPVVWTPFVLRGWVSPQNQKVAELGRYLWRTYSPARLLFRVTSSILSMTTPRTLEYLQGWRLSNSSWLSASFFGNFILLVWARLLRQFSTSLSVHPVHTSSSSGCLWEYWGRMLKAHTVLHKNIYARQHWKPSWCQRSQYPLLSPHLLHK